jgi:hypothetical protein
MNGNLDAIDAKLTILNAAVLILDRDVTLTDVVNTTTETTVYSFSVPGGTLVSTKALRLTLICDYLNNSGGNANLSIAVKYGATVIAGFSNIGPVTTSSLRRGLVLTTFFSAFNASNAQVAYTRGVMQDIGVAGIGGGEAFVRSGVNTGVAEDSSTAKTLLVTFQHDVANANISARALIAQLELL